MNMQNLTPRDLLDMALRRKWFIISAITLSLAGATAVAVLTPKIYRSSTTIIVENQRIPERYVNAVVTGTASDRISMVQQIVLSRTFLEQIAKEFHLYPDNATLADQEVRIDGLRKAIKIETKAQRGDVRVESFTLSFAHENPVTASQVTNRLASQIINENIKTREQLVEGTTKFLEQELKNAEQSLEGQERAIAQFKKRYMGELPGQTAANLQTLDRLQRELANVNDALQNRNDRRTALVKLINSYELMGLANIEQMRETGFGPEPDKAQAPATTPRVTRGAAGDPLTQRLRELERQLATLSAEYKETYPDIIQLKQEIVQIKGRLAERSGQGTQEEAERQDVGRAQGGRRPASTTAGIDVYLHELKREKEEVEIGISTLKEQQRRLQVQIRDFEQRVEKAPEREQELTTLERDYTNTKRNYDSLLDKQLNARISENLEHRQQGETFRIIDPANVPTRPESPDQVKIMLLGLLAGCGLGFGGAFALEQLAGVIHKPEDVESLLGLPVLASIPDFKRAYGVKRGGKFETPLLPGYTPPSIGAHTDSPRVPYVGGPVEPAAKGGYLKWQKQTATSKEGRKVEMGSGQLKLEMNLVAKWRPHSLVAEQFRVAATRLVLSSSGKKLVVVVTSALPGEGKSSTASNLAYVLAHDLGKKTLLIDCDFKRPVIHAYNGVPMRPGLADAIYGDAALENCLHQCGDSSLWILPAGRRDHRMVDLTKISQVATIVTELKEKFDFVLLDAPPIVPVADMNLLASIADMLLLVVRVGMTPQDVLESATKSFRPLNRGAVILTGTEVSEGVRYMQEQYSVYRGVS
ncbi:MAG: XrtA system polysaccharide chain length determinant [Nitrospira sp.]